MPSPLTPHFGLIPTVGFSIHIYPICSSAFDSERRWHWKAISAMPMSSKSLCFDIYIYIDIPIYIYPFFVHVFQMLHVITWNACYIMHIDCLLCAYCWPLMHNMFSHKGYGPGPLNQRAQQFIISNVRTEVGPNSIDRPYAKWNMGIKSMHDT